MAIIRMSDNNHYQVKESKKDIMDWINSDLSIIQLTHLYEYRTESYDLKTKEETFIVFTKHIVSIH